MSAAPGEGDARVDDHGQRPPVVPGDGSHQPRPRTPMTQARWQSLTEWPLAAASVLFLIAYAWSVIGNLQGKADIGFNDVIWGVWVLFVIDYAVNLVLARPRWPWFYRHLLDLAIVVLPVLRPLRVLRLVALMSFLHRAAGTAFRGRVVIYVGTSATAVVLVGALAELDAEQNAAHAEIVSFGDAVWWAFETITTVGYGDYAPVTVEGRVVAVGVMLSGIALLGVITATFASWFVERVQLSEQKTEAATRQHVEALAAEVRALRVELAQRSPSESPDAAPTPGGDLR